jgi:hypothetical protein
VPLNPTRAAQRRRRWDLNGDHVARKPTNFQWLGFTQEQIDPLDFFDFIGNNGWARKSRPWSHLVCNPHRTAPSAR